MGAFKRAAGRRDEALGGIRHVNKTHVTGEGDGVSLADLGGHQRDGGRSAHALITTRSVNDGGANPNARHTPVLPVHGGHLLAADLVRAVEGRQPVIVAHGGCCNRAGITHARNAPLPRQFQHMDAAHHIDARAANGVCLAKGYL